MPDELTPSTNIEKFLAKTAGESVELPEPATRIEKYLNKIASEQTITEETDNWLDEHIDPTTGYVLDSTLTMNNAAPPASAVGDLKSALTPLKDVAEIVNGDVNTDNIPFEIGGMSIGTGGWTYSDSTKKIRIQQGHTIELRPGDKLRFTSYSNIRYYIGWIRENGTYGTMGAWQQADFTALEWGLYTICASNTPEVVITDITTFTNLFRVERLNCLESAIEKPNVKGINHKGYCYVAPENTLPAYALSKEKGYTYVECDIGFTADNVPVLLHDSTINRTARNADGTALSSTVSLSDVDYDDLLQYDFGIWKSATYAGTKIPTFEEFIKFCKYAGLKPYCEIKSTGVTEEKVKILTDIAVACGMSENITWISFSTNMLGYVATNIPTARLGFLVSTMSDSIVSVINNLKTGQNDVFVNLEKGIATDANIAVFSNALIPAESYLYNTSSQVLNASPYLTGISTNCVDVPALLAEYAYTLVE